MHNRFSLQTLYVAAATVFAASTLWADGPALEFTGGSGQHFPGYTVGWTFTVSNALSVQSLGWFDSGSDGLLDSHEVGIFTQPPSGTGTLVVSTNVTAADGLTNGFRYRSISPFTLLPGDYVVAGTTGDDLFQAFCTGVITDTNIGFGQGRFAKRPWRSLCLQREESTR